MPILAADWQMLGSPAADWITAIVALLALIAAAIATWFTAKTNRAQQETLELQRKQYEDAQEQLRRAQAELISFWTEGDFAYVVNASNSPISHIRLLSPHKRALCAYALVVPPTGNSQHSMELPSGLGSLVKASTMLLFTDTAGRRWARNQGGVLSRMNKALFDLETHAVEEADPPLPTAVSLPYIASWASHVEPAYMDRPDESHQSSGS